MSSFEFENRDCFDNDLLVSESTLLLHSKVHIRDRIVHVVVVVAVHAAATLVGVDPIGFQTVVPVVVAAAVANH